MAKLNKKQLEHNRIILDREKERKVYFANMRMIADLLGGEGTFALLPDLVIENSYRSRVLPLKVIVNKQIEIDEKSLQNLQRTFYQLMRQTESVVEISDKKIQIDKVITAGFNIVRIAAFCRSEPIDEKWTDEFASRISLEKVNDLMEKAFDIFRRMAIIIYMYCSKIEGEMFWFKFDSVIPHEGSSQLMNVVELNSEPLQTRKFSKEDGNRLAIRVFWPSFQMGILFSEMKPSLLGIHNRADKPVPVYIQRHALRRIEERLDCLKTTYIQFFIFNSLQNPVIIRKGKNKGLIEFKILDTKMGYFAAEFLEEAVLINTFLFITNDGTPEGKKLFELTGLGMLDKKYLAIDKLSSFISSDITQNLRLRNLFKDAGCGCMLEIEEAVKELVIKQEEFAISGLMIKYLDVERVGT